MFHFSSCIWRTNKLIQSTRDSSIKLHVATSLWPAERQNVRVDVTWLGFLKLMWRTGTFPLAQCAAPLQSVIKQNQFILFLFHRQEAEQSEWGASVILGSWRQPQMSFCESSRSVAYTFKNAYLILYIYMYYLYLLSLTSLVIKVIVQLSNILLHYTFVNVRNNLMT